MADTVFIFGAGASAEVGGPLMNNFMQIGSKINRSLKGSTYQGLFEEVRDLQSKFNPVNAKANIDFDNIESFLGAVEMAILSGGIPTVTVDELKSLREVIIKFIVSTIESSIQYTSRGGRLEPHTHHSIFVKRLNEIIKSNPTRRFSIITFNYDLCFDYSLIFHSIPFDYGFNGKAEHSLSYLKLHGSLNWTKCNNCETLHWISPAIGFGGPAPREEGTIKHMRTSEFLSRLEKQKCCKDFDLDGGPVIIPPTWNKAMYHTTISNIWSAASHSLSEAENIIVIGYSLPSSDEFFKYLYGIGTLGTARLQRFIVCDTDPKVQNKFVSLLPDVLKGKLDFRQNKFSNVIDKLGREIALY